MVVTAGIKVGYTWVYPGSQLGSRWGNMAQDRANIGPTLVKKGADMAQDGPNIGQIEGKMGPSAAYHKGRASDR